MDPDTTCSRRDWALERSASKRPAVGDVSGLDDAADVISEARDSKAAKSLSFQIAAVYIGVSSKGMRRIK